MGAPGIEENSFCRGCFSGINMGDHADIADIG
jgi:hypothetical protein